MNTRATNHEISQTFFAIAELLTLQGANRFRIRAYERAGQAVEALGEEAGAIYSAGGLSRLKEIPSIGADLGSKIEELVITGRLRFLAELERKVPKGLRDILSVEGMGPERTRLVWRRFGAKNISSFERLLKSGKLESVRGWGEKSVQNLLRGVGLRKKLGERMPLPQAYRLAEGIAGSLRDSGLCDRVEVAGSVRRMRDRVKDIDILVTTRTPTKVIERFLSLPLVDEIIARGPTKSRVVLREGIEADLRVLKPDQFGAGLYYFTGSKDHNVAVREEAVRQGITISEYGIYRGTKSRKGKLLAAKTEEDVFEALGMQYVPPELRENRGEIEAARAGTLPRLISVEDIRGDLHSHSSFSDGLDSMVAMASAAKQHGLEYLAITDHASQMGMVAGIKRSNFQEYLRKIGAVRQKVHGIHILAGSEVDILEDGALYLGDAELKKLDWIVASIHSNFRQSERQITARLLKALENPFVSMIGHPTTRILGRRAPIVFDTEKVFAAARRNDVALEVSASPSRLDLDDIHARRAKEAGVKLAISSDAHSVDQFDFRFGAGQARRAWLLKGDVLNSLPWSRFQEWIGRV